VLHKKPELWRKHNWLHRDIEPAQTSLKSREFVTNKNMVIVPHPPYSPDLAPCDFALFPKLKMKLKGRHFETGSDIQRESQALRKMTSTVLLKRGENNGIAVYVPNGLF
jgi:transposase